MLQWGHFTLRCLLLVDVGQRLRCWLMLDLELLQIADRASVQLPTWVELNFFR